MLAQTETMSYLQTSLPVSKVVKVGRIICIVSIIKRGLGSGRLEPVLAPGILPEWYVPESLDLSLGELGVQVGTLNLPNSGDLDTGACQTVENALKRQNISAAEFWERERKRGEREKKWERERE